MKIRNGFVSNSSSSSFIVGVAKIDDYSKFQKRIKEIGFNINGFDAMVKPISEIKSNNTYEYRYYNDTLQVESFVSSADINIKDMDDSDLLFIVNISNNEGDSHFYTDYDDMNYDIDLDFFDREQRELYKMFHDKDSGIDISTKDIRYGAARNG